MNNHPALTALLRVYWQCLANGQPTRASLWRQRIMCVYHVDPSELDVRDAFWTPEDAVIAHSMGISLGVLR